MKKTPPKWKYKEAIEYAAPKRNVDTIFLHCSATDKAVHDDRAVIKAWHLKRGFSDIGYHFFINKNGDIQEGRSLELTPAAQKNNNKGSIAICTHGLKLKKFTDEQLQSVKTLCEKIVASYSAKIRIRGHQEVSSKSCPVYHYKKLLNLDDKGYISSATVTAVVTPKAPTHALDTSKPPVGSKPHLIKLFDEGMKVNALQRILSRIGFQCLQDGVFGQDTYKWLYPSFPTLNFCEVKAS